MINECASHMTSRFSPLCKHRTFWYVNVNIFFSDQLYTENAMMLAC